MDGKPTGINAHRMAEQIRDMQGYVVRIDLSRPPGRVHTVRLELGAVLIDALSELKKELYIELPSNNILIRPQTLQTDEYFRMKGVDTNFTLRLDAVSPATGFTPPSNLSLVAPVTEFRIGPASTGRSFASLVRPIRVDFVVQNLTSYMAGEIGAYLYDSRERSWVEQKTVTDYANGKVSGEMTNQVLWLLPLAMQPRWLCPRDVADSLKAIQAVYRLKFLNNKNFRHTDPVMQADIIKLLLTLVGASYDDGNFPYPGCQKRNDQGCAGYHRRFCPEGSGNQFFGFLLPVQNKASCQSGESIGLVSLSESEQGIAQSPG